MPTVYVTAPESAADDIAKRLLSDRLVACINAVDCRSTYHWEGEIVHDEEVILLAKTTDERYEEVEATVQELHPYDVPCIERFDESDVSAAFGKWRQDVVEEE